MYYYFLKMKIRMMVELLKEKVENRILKQRQERRDKYLNAVSKIFFFFLYIFNLSFITKQFYN
jgi:hypothetical protein